MSCVFCCIQDTDDGVQCWAKYADKFAIQTDSLERDLEECDELLQEAVLGESLYAANAVEIAYKY
jgi:hypothetical protein